MASQMSSCSDFQFPGSKSSDLEPDLDKKNPAFLSELGAQLAFIQDATGKYLSFYWQEAELYNISSVQVVDRWMGDIFGPSVVAPYLERVRQILETLIPERFSYLFKSTEHYFLFDLIISPILTFESRPTQVLVMGCLLEHSSRELVNPEHQDFTEHLNIRQKLLYKVISTIRKTLPPSSELYQKLQSQIARNIRRTLDLETIWQQTVNGLGQALRVSRCLICPYQPAKLESSSAPVLEIVAEYHVAEVSTVLGQTIRLTEEPYLTQALETTEPIIVEQMPVNPWNCNSLMAVITCYQEKPNGLIILHQCSISDRPWSRVEIEFVREIADQVGTAIAHATLYKELEDARQQAEAASRLKSEFLANTSHELRTPLNGMIGFLKLIIDGMADDPDEQKEFIEEAYRSALHLLNLINDVLDIAKIEAGKMQLDLSPVKLNELLVDVEDLTRAQVHQKRLNFKVVKPATYDEIILYGNYQRLLQVLLNLVGNSIKFTHEGGVTISAEIMKKKVVVHNEELPGMVKVRVADTGIGVSLDKQDKLFQSFSQVDGSRTRQYGGTGLGLAISQRLVEAMGGIVNFFSMGEGLGSTVTFTIPLYQNPVMILSSANGEANNKSDLDDVN